jgi:cell division protein FtsW
MKHLSFKFEGDRKIWILLGVLAFISIISVYSSTYRLTMRSGNLTGPILRHISFLFSGFVVIYIMHRMAIQWYKMIIPIILAFIVICLILVLLIQTEGEKRWLFSRSFQPSDLAKVFMVGYLAKVISDGFGGSIKKLTFLALFPVFLVCGLIITGHTSNAAIIGGVSMVIILMGSTKRKYRIFSVALFFLIASFYLSYSIFVKDIGRSETGSNRITAWKEGVFSSSKNNYEQAETARYAIVSGGLFQFAPGKSFYRKTLSEAHNDFIFAMIVEEYGMTGGIFVITVYLMLFYRVLKLLKKCTRPFTSLLVAGLLLLIISQTFIHIGVSVGGFPITGQNLPLISTGGSSILVTCIAFGMILATSRIAEENEREKLHNQNKCETV